MRPPLDLVQDPTYVQYLTFPPGFGTGYYLRSIPYLRTFTSDTLFLILLPPNPNDFKDIPTPAKERRILIKGFK